MDGEDPLACWHLFSYTALLNESRYLSRTIKRITAALYSSEDHDSVEAVIDSAPEQEQPDLNAPSSSLNERRCLLNIRRSVDNGGLKALDFSLKQLESDVTKALEIVKSTIDMVFLKC